MFKHTTLFAAVAGLVLALAGSAQAADVYWDGGTENIAGDGDGVSQGGAGTWDTTIENWDVGVAPHVAWNNTNNDAAIFSGTAGTVTLGTGITVGGLQFDTAGYTVTGDTLTFGAAGAITANTNATISSGVAGGAGATITKAGSGALTLSGNNNFSGDITINGGTLTFSTLNSWGGSTKNVTFGGTSTLTSTASGYSGGQLTVNSGVVGTITGSNLTFASATGSGNLIFAGASATLNIGDASGFTGNLQTRIGGGTNPHPKIQFSSLTGLSQVSCGAGGSGEELCEGSGHFA